MAQADEVLLVAQGTTRDADTFFAGRWPQARVVCDTQRVLYGAFGLERATLGQLFAPGVFGAFWRNRQHGVGLPVGDTLLLAGAFVIERGTVTAEHRSQTPADHPDWARMLARVRAARTPST